MNSQTAKDAALTDLIKRLTAFLKSTNDIVDAAMPITMAEIDAEKAAQAKPATGDAPKIETVVGGSALGGSTELGGFGGSSGGSAGGSFCVEIPTPRVRFDMRPLVVAVAEIGQAMTDLSKHFLLVDAGPNPPAGPGDVAVQLRRTAWRLEHGTLDGWDEEEIARKSPRWTLEEMQKIQKDGEASAKPKRAKTME